jgi:FMN-dependent NADH-azoreductase
MQAHFVLRAGRCVLPNAVDGATVVQHHASLIDRKPLMKLLHLDSSLLGAKSVSRELSAAVVAAWRLAEPNATVVYRDLAQDVPPQLTGELLQAMRFNQPPTSPAAIADLATINTMLDEFLAADGVVIGAPMYNFSVPTQLKAWIDALSQPGKTFAYTPQGPQGLAGDKRVVIASARGNFYSAPPMSARDYQETYLAAALGFMGIKRIDVVRAEGVNRSPEQRTASLQAAHAQIGAMFGDATQR